MALPALHERFCHEYLVDLNGSAAYRRVYPKVKSEKVGRTNAARLLANAGVQARVAELQKEREERTAITSDWVLKRLKEEAEFTGEGSTHSARVSALGLAMKHLGMLKEDAPHPDRVPFDLTKLTDAALARLDAILAPVFDPGPQSGGRA